MLIVFRIFYLFLVVMALCIIWHKNLCAQIKHPELPKKPLTPYFRFFMRKRLSYSKKHPNMSVTELTKELSKKYGALSEHKKVSAVINRLEFLWTVFFVLTTRCSRMFFFH